MRCALPTSAKRPRRTKTKRHRHTKTECPKHTRTGAKRPRYTRSGSSSNKQHSGWAECLGKPNHRYIQLGILEKDVQYVSIPGSTPKIAAMQQGIIQAALLAPPADYIAIKAGFKRLVNLADLFKDTSFSGLAATGKTIKERPQYVKRVVRALVRGVYQTRDNREDAIQTMIKHFRMEREAAIDAYNLVREALDPVPTEKGVELMAQWQSIALNVKPKHAPREYMDLRFVKEVVSELAAK